MAPLDPAFAATLRNTIRRDVDERMEFVLNCVAKIRRTASGKHRFVVSNCG